MHKSLAHSIVKFALTNPKKGVARRYFSYTKK